MTETEIPSDRIREYLRQLTAKARARLLAEMERLLLCGEEIPNAGPVLDLLRAESRKEGKPHDRVGNPSRYFFQPLEPVLVDSTPERASSGQISRGSLAAIWEWISQNLLPTMAREYSEKMRQVIVGGNPREAQQAAAAFQTKVAKYLESVLRSETGAAEVGAGLAIYTSSRAVLDDLTKILCFLRARDALAAFNAALPLEIATLDDNGCAKVQGLLDALKAGNAEAIPFALTMVANRLKSPWQLIRLATRSAKSKAAADIAATPYAVAVPMVLDRIDDKRLALRQALRNNRIPFAKDILNDIYRIENALIAHIDGFNESDWGQRLNDLMEVVTVLVETEVRTIPSDVQHVLRSPRLRHRNSLSGRLTDMARKSRDVLGGLVGAKGAKA